MKMDGNKNDRRKERFQNVLKIVDIVNGKNLSKVFKTKYIRYVLGC